MFILIHTAAPREIKTPRQSNTRLVRFRVLHFAEHGIRRFGMVHEMDSACKSHMTHF